MTALSILPLIALISTVFIIYLILTRAQRSQSAIIWTVLLFLFLLWTIGEFLQKSLTEKDAVVTWTSLCIIFGDIFPAIFLIFTLMFPYQNDLFNRYRWLFIAIIIVPKIFSVTVTLTFPAAKTIELEENAFGYYPFFDILLYRVPFGSWYFYLGIAHSMVLVFIGAFVLLWNYMKTEIESVRRNTRLILIGLALWLGIGASTAFIGPMFTKNVPELFSLGTMLLNFIVAYGLLQGRILLFSPITETGRKKDYSETIRMGEYYLCSPDRGIRTFTELVDHGYEGLYVGAVKPNLDITKFKRTPIVIITEAGKGFRQYGNLQYVPAEELRTFKTSIFTFVKSATRGVIYLDNMDVILEKNWAPPWEFVEMGMEMKGARIVNAIWLFGSPIKKGDDLEPIRDVMGYPVIKKAVVLDKLNSILSKVKLPKAEVDDLLERLSKIEPFYSHLKFQGEGLKYDESLGEYEGILGLDSTETIRTFVQQIQARIPPEVFKDILFELRKYGISRFEFLLRAGDTYLVEESFEDLGRTYEVYLDFLEKGYDGMCITRTEPSKLLSKFPFPSNSRIYWLTQDRREDNDIKPAPEYLMVHIKSFIETHRQDPGVILLDGLEYLITFQGDQFDSYLKVLRRIADLISQSRLVLLIPYDPEAISPERVALFRRSGIEVISKDMLV